MNRIYFRKLKIKKHFVRLNGKIEKHSVNINDPLLFKVFWYIRNIFQKNKKNIMLLISVLKTFFKVGLKFILFIEDKKQAYSSCIKI